MSWPFFRRFASRHSSNPQGTSRTTTQNGQWPPGTGYIASNDGYTHYAPWPQNPPQVDTGEYDEYVQFAKAQLAHYDPETIALVRTPFKTLGPMPERIRLGYIKRYPGLILPSAEYLSAPLSGNPLEMTFQSFSEFWLDGDQHAPSEGDSDDSETEWSDQGEGSSLATRESFTAPMPLEVTFSTRIIRTPDHYRKRVPGAPRPNNSDQEMDSDESSDMEDRPRAITLSRTTPKTAGKSSSSSATSINSFHPLRSRVESGSESEGDIGSIQANEERHSDPWNNQAVVPSPLARGTNDPFELGYLSPNLTPLSPIVDTHSIEADIPWPRESQGWAQLGGLTEEFFLGNDLPPALASYPAQDRIPSAPTEPDEPMLKSILRKTAGTREKENPYYQAPSAGPSTSIAGRFEASAQLTSSSQSTSISRNSGTTTTVHSISSSSATVAAASYYSSPAPSSTSYDADIESVSFTSPRFEDFYSPSLSDNMSPPLLGILRDFENSPGPTSSYMSPPARPTQPMVAHGARNLPFNLRPTETTKPTHPLGTSSLSAPPNSTEVVTGIVHSISRSTTDLVSAVLNPTENVPSSGTSATTVSSGVGWNGLRGSSTSPASAPSTSPASASATSSAAISPDSALGSSSAGAGSDAIVSSHSRSDSSMSLFSNASQFGMRDPNFHVASRDVQVVNVYNITLNQVQATTTRTTTGGAAEQ